MKTERSAIEQKMEKLLSELVSATYELKAGLSELVSATYELKAGEFGIPENEYEEMTDIFEEILDDCIKSKYRILGLVEKLKF